MKKVDLQIVTKPDVTIIPNYIIDKDMLDANELQLKVYLYILRNTSAGISVQISSMADYFNETEKDIERAISFWEKRGVFECASSSEAAKPSMPAISKDDFQTLTDNQDFKELTFVAETYMGKTLSKTDLETLLFIKEHLSFSNELIEYLLEYCAERGKKSFKYVQTVALSWSKDGVTTPEDAQVQTAKFSQRIYAVMNALGKKNEPTNAELNYINRWYEQYGFEGDIILEACRRTVLATDRNRFSYCDKILSSWYASGVHHASDISRADASYQTHKKQGESIPRKVPGYVSNNPFLHFKQSSTDYDALEKELLQN
jgi:DnaD/phage-associated family protein